LNTEQRGGGERERGREREREQERERESEREREREYGHQFAEGDIICLSLYKSVWTNAHK